eukprot:2179576-Prymnesium_polylepis.2
MTVHERGDGDKGGIITETLRGRLHSQCCVRRTVEDEVMRNPLSLSRAAIHVDGIHTRRVFTIFSLSRPAPRAAAGAALRSGHWPLVRAPHRTCGSWHAAGTKDLLKDGFEVL